jgi:hypothetical protein
VQRCEKTGSLRKRAKILPKLLFYHQKRDKKAEKENKSAKKRFFIR